MRMYAIVFSFLMAACGNQPPEDRKTGYEPARTGSDSVFHLVMEQHDAGMAKIGKLKAAEARLHHLLDSMNKRKSASLAYRNLINNVLKNLQEAENDMNKWMDTFKADSAQGNEERRVEYLKTEYEKVERVRRSIDESIGRAEALK